jgi:hypothetical protein
MHLPHPCAHRASWPRRLAWLLAALALAMVFLMYSQPEFMLQMANQVWACF